MFSSEIPTVGIVPDFRRQSRKIDNYYKLYACYVEAIHSAGAIPLIIPYIGEERSVLSYIKIIDGIMFTGSRSDIPSKFYSSRPSPHILYPDEEKTEFEILLFKESMKKGIPILGICGGLQLINVALGGTLITEIRSKKFQSHSRGRTYHKVRILEDTRLHSIVGVNEMIVNSTHHQAIREMGRGLRVCALSPDGVVEAVEKEGRGFLLAVQWHPERLVSRDEYSKKIFEGFIKACMTKG